MERLQRLALSLDEAAKAAGVGRTLLKQEIRNKRLVARKIGRRTVIIEDDFATWLRDLPRLGEPAAA
jgi:excisionase family DNA binding protein